MTTVGVKGLSGWIIWFMVLWRRIVHRRRLNGRPAMNDDKLSDNTKPHRTYNSSNTWESVFILMSKLNTISTQQSPREREREPVGNNQQWNVGTTTRNTTKSTSQWWYSTSTGLYRQNIIGSTIFRRHSQGRFKTLVHWPIAPPPKGGERAHCWIFTTSKQFSAEKFRRWAKFY